MMPLAQKDLERSGISEADAERAGLFDVEDASEIYEDFAAEPGLVIPYYLPDGEPMQFERDGASLPFCRVRYLDPKVARGFTPGKAQRYSQPGNSGTRAYFCPLIDWPKLIGDAQEPLIITEGEKKAIAACAAGFPVIALGGVFNFTNGGDELMPELELVKWRGRDVYICFDSDAALNPNILAAEARLVDELQRKRGARCYLVRIPDEDTEDGAKVGLDDFLLAYGPAAFTGLLASCPSLGAMDAKIVSLNKTCAWIEQEGMVYDMEEKKFIKKDNFTTGSRFSAIKHITVGGTQRKKEPKSLSVAAAWLTHPHAQRFGEILFRPGEGPVVETDHGRPALNMWSGWEGIEGDVTPWLDLTKFLFQSLPEEHQDLPIKLMAYKAQNPAEKVPLALVLVGPQGCGKTLWAECLMDAFRPYSEAVTSKAFHGDFQGWLEKSLLVLINEAEGHDMTQGADVLKSLISDLKRPMNEKFRPARQINAYASYIITSNRRAVGAFAADDRRMIVVDCPKAREPAFYFDYVKPWRRRTNGKVLLNYLLTLDLKGWEPPAVAPMTAEKYLAYTESLTAGQALAEEMKTADEQTIELWLDQATAWAQVAEVGNNPSLAAAARATLDGVKHMQIRPFYEPRELALLFPNLVQTLLGGKFDRSTPPGKISRELRDAGIPYLVCSDDPKGFRWKGLVRQYLVIAEFDEWKQPLSQNEFERLMNNFPMYGQRRRHK